MVGELANRLIVDSVAFGLHPVVSQTAPRLLISQGQITMQKPQERYRINDTLFSHRIRQACYSPEPNSHQVQANFIIKQVRNTSLFNKTLAK